MVKRYCDQCGDDIKKDLFGKTDGFYIGVRTDSGVNMGLSITIKPLGSEEAHLCFTCLLQLMGRRLEESKRQEGNDGMDRRG